MLGVPATFLSGKFFPAVVILCISTSTFWIHKAFRMFYHVAGRTTSLQDRKMSNAAGDLRLKDHGRYNVKGQSETLYTGALRIVRVFPSAVASTSELPNL